MCGRCTVDMGSRASTTVEDISKGVENGHPIGAEITGYHFPVEVASKALGTLFVFASALRARSPQGSRETLV